MERFTSSLLFFSSSCLIVFSMLLTFSGPTGIVVHAAPPVIWQPTVDMDRVMSSPDYGMQVFLFWREEVANRDVTVVEQAGFRWVKQQFAWRDIEGAGKGEWAWENPDRMMRQIESQNLKVIARLDNQPQWAAPDTELPEISPPDNLQDYYDYVYAIASRYKGRIQAYQIWNEPNLAREWGGRAPNPAEYVELLKVGYKAVKDADPKAIVISAGLAPTTRYDDVAMPDSYFVQGMYDAGATPYFDALGVHAAGFKSSPDIDPAQAAIDPILTNGDLDDSELSRVYAFRHVEDIRDLMVKNGDADKKVVILEFGWTVEPRPESPYRWHAVTHEEQAAYFTGAYEYAIENWQPWIGVMNLIYVANPDWHMDMEETYWSIVYPYYPELRVAPAYEHLKHMTKIPAVE
ncbi:beta-galactosidase [Anaerolineales bacterium HSG6]|nr:beta-galactosidase [Anaerolineales bacterium HSG6]MDM8532241.1 beta-galactosidase [Anaerolineales bacterium HSG25]